MNNRDKLITNNQFKGLTASSGFNQPTFLSLSSSQLVIDAVNPYFIKL